MRRKVVIYEEYCRITGGDPLSAAVLWVLESRAVESVVSISLPEIQQYLLGLCVGRHIRSRLVDLQERGFIGRIPGPAAMAARYRIYPDNISAAVSSDVEPPDNVYLQRDKQAVLTKGQTGSASLSLQRGRHGAVENQGIHGESPSDGKHSCPYKGADTGEARVLTKGQTRPGKQADLTDRGVLTKGQTQVKPVSLQMGRHKNADFTKSTSETADPCPSKGTDMDVGSVITKGQTQARLVPARTPARARVDSLPPPVFQESFDDDDYNKYNSAIHRVDTGGIAHDPTPLVPTAVVEAADRERCTKAPGAGIDPTSRDPIAQVVDPRDPTATTSEIAPADPTTHPDRARQSADAAASTVPVSPDRAPVQVSETPAPVRDPIASGFALQPSSNPTGAPCPPQTPIASPERNGAHPDLSQQPAATPVLRQIALIHEASKGLLAVYGKKRYPPILMLECEPDEKTILSAAMRMKETSPSDDELREIGRMIVAKSKFPFKGRSEQTYPLKLLVGDRIWGPLMLEVRGSLRAKAPSSEKPAGPARPLHDGKYPYSDAEIRGAFMMGTLSREEWPDLSKAFPPDPPAPPRKERKII